MTFTSPTAPRRPGGRLTLAWVVPALLLAGVPAARADLIETATVGPVSLDDPGTYPASQYIGTFSFMVPSNLASFGGAIESATVSGQWGTSFLTPDTAPGTYTVGGVTVFTCNDGDACSVSGSQTPWSYNFMPSELAALATGSADFDVVQTDFGQVQADVTTLTVDIFLPEPATLTVFGTALFGMALMRRRNRP